MGVRRLTVTGLVLAVVGLNGCARHDTSDAPGPAVPYADFVAGVRSARYADYAGRSGVAVRDESAFEQMRRHLLHLYGSVTATRTVLIDGTVFDCLPVPSAAASPPPSPGDPPPSGAGASPSVADPRRGSGASGVCPAGSSPTRRISLDDLARFPTLADFLGKGPGGPGAGGPPPIGAT
jgi:hypothetical protein